MLQPSTLKFLKDLKKNNNKPWFDAHRPAYETARKDFEIFVQSLIDGIGKKDGDISGLTAKACMFRINRDVRFSKDKSPYKSNFGAFFNKGGKKAMTAGYYFHLEPGKIFVGGGLYMPMPPDLAKVRQEIDYNLKDFKKIVLGAKFKKVYKDLDHSDEYTLTRVPKGYEADNPAAEYLKLKSYVATIKMSDADVISATAKKKVVEAYEALMPLVKFLNGAIE
ncbi:MAG: TIGR02453 family protein [Sphingobacteriales bacterium 12-47-4]|nr:MAG: TIGR02453 family protein [Sphingobacteriales bacterium 12-47-4]